MEKISVIVPCYNESKCLSTFYEEMQKVIDGMNSVNFEVIFVDDGSTDCTLDTIKYLATLSGIVRYISLSRNFGKESAIFAGLEYSTGDYIAIIDADLQHPPHLLEKMYTLLKSEYYDCVATKRATRNGEPLIRTLFSKTFYKLNNSISDVKIVEGACDYRIMTRKMVEGILSLKERSRFSKGLFSWVGYNTKFIEYDNIERISGKTKWSFWKLLMYSMDGIISFSTAPLIWVSFLGFLACLIAFVMIFYYVIQKLTVGIEINGYAAMITIILFLGGVQLLSIGILGQYVARIFTEAKQRPIYLVKEISDNFNEKCGF